MGDILRSFFGRPSEPTEKQKEIIDLIKNLDIDFDISDNGSLSSIKNAKKFDYATDLIKKQKGSKVTNKVTN